MVDNEPTAHELAEWAAGLNDGQLLCRTKGHAPLPSSVHVEVLDGTRRHIYVQTDRCRNRCGVTWTEGIDMNSGARYFRKTHYPKGYLAKGIGRIFGEKKNVVRLEDVTRRYKKGQ